MIISREMLGGPHAPFWRGWLLGLVLLAVSGGLTQASAAWTGYWTWNGQNWVWTWVWTSPPASCCSALSPSAAAIGSTGKANDDCCGITIFDFAKIQPSAIERSGLLASEFTISGGDSSDSDLRLSYTGKVEIGPGTFLGSMTLDDPAAVPASSPAVDLTYRESFVDAAGEVLSESGTITSAVPEPGSLFLLAGFVLGWTVWRLAPFWQRSAAGRCRPPFRGSRGRVA